MHIPPRLRLKGTIEASSSGEKPVWSEDSSSCDDGTLSVTGAPSVSDARQLSGDALDYTNEEPSPLVASPPESEQSEESQFLINLEFPDQRRLRLAYRVYANMPVRLFYQAIANGILECRDYQIRIYVGDKCILHLGTITDRYFPGLRRRFCFRIVLLM